MIVEVALIIVMMLPGREPKQHKFPMPSIEDCLQEASNIAHAAPITKALENGGILHVDCEITVPPTKSTGDN